MNVYRWVWRAAWLMIGAVPAGLGILEASPVALFCLGTSIAAVVAATGQPSRTWIAAGLLGAAVVAGLWSAGVAGFYLLMLAFTTAPFVVARVCGLSSRRRPDPTKLRSDVPEVDAMSVLSADLLAGPVHALEDQQLFLLWSESYVALKLTRSVEGRLKLVNLRQGYLDEFESRNPTGFACWLRSGALPVENPQSFFEVRESHAETPPSFAVDDPIEGSRGSRVDRTGNGSDSTPDPDEQGQGEP